VVLSFLGIRYLVSIKKRLIGRNYRGPDSAFFWIYRMESDLTSGRKVEEPSPDRRVSIAWRRGKRRTACALDDIFALS